MEYEKQVDGFDADLFNNCTKVIMRDYRMVNDDTEHIGIIYFLREGGVVIQLQKKIGEDVSYRKFYLSAVEASFLYDELWEAKTRGVI